MNKAQTIEFWKEQIATQQAWAGRALLRIAAEQTADELEARGTFQKNSVGFSALDASILTSLAEQLKDRGTLSPKQWAIVHKRMPRYAGQLYRLTQPATGEA